MSKRHAIRPSSSSILESWLISPGSGNMQKENFPYLFKCPKVGWGGGSEFFLEGGAGFFVPRVVVISFSGT